MRGRTGLRARVLTLALVAFGLGLTACGSDDDGGSTAAATGAATSAAPAESTLVAQARELTETARRGLVYATVETPTEPSQIEPYGEWRGPDRAPRPAADVNVQVIACSRLATGCLAGAEGAVEAARSLGWRAELIDGGGQPQGWARAFNTALQRDADVIVAVAVPTVAVADSLAQARRQGVLTIAVADEAPAEGDGYDGYVAYPIDATWAVAAWTAIADADGRANEIVPQETDYPVIVAGVANYETVMGACDECSVETVDWQVADSMDPARVSRMLGGALSRAPDATGVFVSLGHVLPALAETLAQDGRDLSVGVGAADPTAIELVSQGVADYTVGTPPRWAGWAGIDQAVRGLAREPMLGPLETGLGIGELTTETAPESGDFGEWDGAIDYAAEYQRIWDVG